MKVGKIFAILLFITSILPANSQEKREAKDEETFLTEDEVFEMLKFLDLLENLNLIEDIQFLEDFEILYFQGVPK